MELRRERQFSLECRRHFDRFVFTFEVDSEGDVNA